uniref:Uncharacterized protein n=1 Tax=Hanusia phi TaxID=3032 RepID=A0A7S0NFU8_9CRYP
MARSRKLQGGTELILVTMAVVAACLVVSRKTSRQTVLQGNLADKVTAKFLARFQQSKHEQDLDTVKKAAKVFSKFGGSFHDGVGTNTWKGTPWAKYDDKDIHTESLSHISGRVSLRARRGKRTMLYEENDGRLDKNFVRGWNKVDITKESMNQLYHSIDKQLEPLAEAYPHLRAIRH